MKKTNSFSNRLRNSNGYHGWPKQRYTNCIANGGIAGNREENPADAQMHRPACHHRHPVCDFAEWRSKSADQFTDEQQPDKQHLFTTPNRLFYRARRIRRHLQLLRLLHNFYEGENEETGLLR